MNLENLYRNKTFVWKKNYNGMQRQFFSFMKLYKRLLIKDDHLSIGIVSPLL